MTGIPGGEKVGIPERGWMGAAHTIATLGGTGLLGLWVWMLLMTSVWFHNPPEKLMGLGEPSYRLPALRRLRPSCRTLRRPARRHPHPFLRSISRTIRASCYIQHLPNPPSPGLQAEHGPRGRECRSARYSRRQRGHQSHAVTLTEFGRSVGEGGGDWQGEGRVGLLATLGLSRDALCYLASIDFRSDLCPLVM
jgi:hypothetical protein